MKRGRRPFHDLPLDQRALEIRFNADWQWRAVTLQHERLMAIPEPRPGTLVEDALRGHLQGITDMDFFITAIRRLLRVADLTRRSGCDTGGELKLALKLFNSQWGHVIRVRDALEHFDDWERREGVPTPASGGGNYMFMWAGGNVDAQKLFESAEKLCRALYNVIEPLILELPTQPIS